MHTHTHTLMHTPRTNARYTRTGWNQVGWKEASMRKCKPGLRVLLRGRSARGKLPQLGLASFICNLGCTKPNKNKSIIKQVEISKEIIVSQGNTFYGFSFVLFLRVLPFSYATDYLTSLKYETPRLISTYI